MPKPEGYVLRAFRNIPQKARTGIYGSKRVDVANRVSSDYEVRWVPPLALDQYACHIIAE